MRVAYNDSDDRGAGLRGYVQFNKYTYIHAYIHTYIHTVSLIPPWEDQREWHRMTRMTRPDCAVMCNLINIHTYIHTYIHTQVSGLVPRYLLPPSSRYVDMS